MKPKDRCLITGVALAKDKIISDYSNDDEFTYWYPGNENVRVTFTNYAIDTYDGIAKNPELLAKLKEALAVEVRKMISKAQPSDKNQVPITFDDKYMQIVISNLPK